MAGKRRQHGVCPVLAALATWACLAMMTLTSIAQAAEPKPTPGSVANPTVTGPIAGGRHGYPWGAYPYPLAPHRYMQEEYFIAGSAYSDGVPGPNEMSNGTRVGYADYVTRILVIRPIDHRDFNGTAFLEWVNTSAGIDGLVEWGWMHPMLMREGYAYVAVSAQNNWQASQSVGPATVSVDSPNPLALKSWDPERYGPLSHPGDEFARDIFSQAVQAIRYPVGIDPMGGLRPEYLLAGGMSQSADRLGTYIERDQAKAGLVDGFLVDDDQRGTPGYAPYPFLNPGATKILHFRTESFPNGPEPTSSENYRRWEVAGTSHKDYWTIKWSLNGTNPVLDNPQGTTAGEEQAHEDAGNYGERVDPASLTCAIGNQFPRRYANDAAVAALNTWVRTGTPAPSAPPLQTVTVPGGQTTWARDANGNVMGGLRLPPIDVPVATYLATACNTSGISVPFDPARLALLYPSHDAYVEKMQHATDAAVAKGWLLPDDANDLMRRASTSSIGALPAPLVG